MGSTAKGYPFPDITDPPDGPSQIGALAQAVDDTPGITVATYAEINAYAGADVWEGRTVYQSNTGTNRPTEGPVTHNGVEWRKPWNMPWGIMPSGVVSITSSQLTTGSTITDITGLTLLNTFVANRWVRITVGPWRGAQSSSGQPIVYIHDGTTSRVVWQWDAAAGVNYSATSSLVQTPAAGSKTYKVQVNGNGGSLDFLASVTNPVLFYAEDIGPAGAAA